MELENIKSYLIRQDELRYLALFEPLVLQEKIEKNNKEIFAIKNNKNKETFDCVRQSKLEDLNKVYNFELSYADACKKLLFNLN